jgi:PTS system mannose-specific IIC component
VGALLELYALDTLPVGATRAPDWGPGSVAAGALVALHQRTLAAPGLLGLVFVAVGSAWLGGWLSHLVRRSNGSEVRRHLELVDRGDAAALATIQRQGLFLDGARALGLTALAYVAGEVLLALVLAHWRLPTSVALVALVATSAAVALHAGWRVTGRGAAAWLAGGLILGAVVALWPR